MRNKIFFIEICYFYTYIANISFRLYLKFMSVQIYYKNSITKKNVADINDWLTSILPGGTNCYNIATTYWRKDFPQYVFGPYKGDDITIGVLLNVTTIFDYIAGMYPMDSGTVARYNNHCSKTLVDNPPFQDCCDCLQRSDTVCYPDIDPSEFITSDKSKRKSKSLSRVY